MSLKQKQLPEGGTNVSLNVSSCKITVRALNFKQSWQDTCKNAPSCLANICRANAELKIVLNADNEFLKENKHIKNDIVQVIKDCIKEEKQNIAVMLDDLQRLCKEIQQVCSKAIGELTEKQEDMPITEVVVSSETAMSIAYLLEMWSDVKQITWQEYAFKKYALECFMDDDNLDEEQMYTMLRDSSDFTKIYQNISFINKLTA